MKFLLPFTLAANAFAASCGILSNTGCIDMIVADAYDIGNQTRDIGCIAAAIEPNCVFTMLKLQSATTTLIDSINRAGCAINSSCPSLALTESLPLIPVLESLVPTITRSMSILQKKKPVFDHAIVGVVSLSWLVRNDLNLVLQATQSMANAIKSKAPESAYTIVDNLTTDILTPLRTARDIFAL